MLIFILISFLLFVFWFELVGTVYMNLLLFYFLCHTRNSYESELVAHPRLQLGEANNNKSIKEYHAPIEKKSNT